MWEVVSPWLRAGMRPIVVTGLGLACAGCLTDTVLAPPSAPAVVVTAAPVAHPAAVEPVTIPLPPPRGEAGHATMTVLAMPLSNEAPGAISAATAPVLAGGTGNPDPERPSGAPAAGALPVTALLPTSPDGGARELAPIAISALNALAPRPMLVSATMPDEERGEEPGDEPELIEARPGDPLPDEPPAGEGPPDNATQTASLAPGMLLPVARPASVPLSPTRRPTGDRMWRAAYPHVVTECFPADLREALQQIGERFDTVVEVTSGHRARGRRGSYHRKCMAADIRVPGVTRTEVRRFAQTLPGIRGIGTYRRTDILHIDTRAVPFAWRY